MKNMRAKKRLLSVCRMQAKLSQWDLIHAESQAVRLEISHAQILAIADDMLGTIDSRQSAMLAGRLEFGHRLIALSSVQKLKMAEAQNIAKALRSSVHSSTLREERAEQKFRSARNFHDQQVLEKQTYRIGKHRILPNGLKRGLSS